MNTSDYRRFGGISRLFGKESFERLSQSHVCIVGVGGVGSWAAEAIARTAIGRITIIDGDTVEQSNTNRQLPAMDGQYGRKKVEVLAERFKAINPQVHLEAKDIFINEENIDEAIGCPDIVLDCIDSLKAKAQLIAWAKRKNIPLIVSAGAGGEWIQHALKLMIWLESMEMGWFLLCAPLCEKIMDFQKGVLIPRVKSLVFQRFIVMSLFYQAKMVRMVLECLSV